MNKDFYLKEQLKEVATGNNEPLAENLVLEEFERLNMIINSKEKEIEEFKSIYSNYNKSHKIIKNLYE